jgi:predicted RNase H-like nuclease
MNPDTVTEADRKQAQDQLDAHVRATVPWHFSPEMEKNIVEGVY